MNLSVLGFDHWFADRAKESCDATSSVARITAVDRDRYLVRDELGEIPAELTGRYRRDVAGTAQAPCVGDWACIRPLDGHTHAIIERLLPRRSFLRRKAAGRDVDFQMIAANIDVAFIVQSCHFDFNVQRLERYLVMARDGHVEPVVLLTKTDLVTPDVLEQLVGRIRARVANARIICLSNVTGSGVEQVRELIAPGRTYCLLGSSGVGKTTLINRLVGDGALETGAVSHTGEGRHTTTRRQLIVLENGGLLIDMPGMRELGLLAVDAGLAETFADIGTLAASCRFGDCTHADEPGCAVRAAMERGEITEQRLHGYKKLRREAAHHDMSHAERRRKDREFGRLVRSVLRHKDRRDPG